MAYFLKKLKISQVFYSKLHLSFLSRSNHHSPIIVSLSRVILCTYLCISPISIMGNAHCFYCSQIRGPRLSIPPFLVRTWHSSSALLDHCSRTPVSFIIFRTSRMLTVFAKQRHLSIFGNLAMATGDFFLNRY